MREIVPGVAVGAVVLAYRAPLPLAQVGSPLLPGGLEVVRLLQARVFGGRWRCGHSGILERRGVVANDNTRRPPFGPSRETALSDQRPLPPRGAGAGAGARGAGGADIRGAGSGRGAGRGAEGGAEGGPETGAPVPPLRPPLSLCSSTNPRDPGVGGAVRVPRLTWPRGTPSPASPRAPPCARTTPPLLPSRTIRRVGSPNRCSGPPATGPSCIRGTRPWPPVGGTGGFQPGGGCPNLGSGTHWVHKPGCQHHPTACAKFQLPYRYGAHPHGYDDTHVYPNPGYQTQVPSANGSQP